MTTPNEELRKLAESAKPKPIGNMASQQEKSAHMTRHMDARMALARAMEPEHVITMCDFMQSQAERIKELEAENGKLSDLWSAMKAKRDELREKYTDTYWALDDAARENTSLRAQLAESISNHEACKSANTMLLDEIAAIAATEPVLIVEKEPDYWSGGHFHEGSKSHIKPTKVWCLPVGTKLFTRPMPAQDVTLSLTDVQRTAIYESVKYEGDDGYWCVNWSDVVDATLDAALSKYKGAKL